MSTCQVSLMLSKKVIPLVLLFLTSSPILLSWPGGISGKEPTCQCRRRNRRRCDPWVGKMPWRRDWLPTPVFLDFPSGSDGKESACNAGDLSSIPGSRRSPEEGNGYRLQYSGLENTMDREAWQATVHSVAKSWTQLSD